jgi:hypothetical protein
MSSGSAEAKEQAEAEDFVNTRQLMMLKTHLFFLAFALA